MFILFSVNCEKTFLFSVKRDPPSLYHPKGCPLINGGSTVTSNVFHYDNILTRTSTQPLCKRNVGRTAKKLEEVLITRTRFLQRFFDCQLGYRA